jgi:hypothetical protein
MTGVHSPGRSRLIAERSILLSSQTNELKPRETGLHQMMRSGFDSKDATDNVNGIHWLTSSQSKDNGGELCPSTIRHVGAALSACPRRVSKHACGSFSRTAFTRNH